jgi:hypothetical protein
VALIAAARPQGTAGYYIYKTPFPIVGSIHIHDGPSAHDGAILVRGLHIRGGVTYTASNGGIDPLLEFDECRVDSSFITRTGMARPLRVHGCTVFGGMDLEIYYLDLVANTIAGGLSVSADGQGYVHGNFVVGPAPAGITVFDDDGMPQVSDNVVTGVVDGIVDHADAAYVGNVIHDCSGAGFTSSALSPYDSLHPGLTGNTITRCAGDGISFFQSWDSPWSWGQPIITCNTITDIGQSGIHAGTRILADAIGNTIENTGGQGIWLATGGHVRQNLILGTHGAGIVSESESEDGGGDITENKVIGSVGDGIVALKLNSVVGNVVGHCGGRGLVASSSTRPEWTDGNSRPVIRNNTLYLNGEEGLFLTSPAITENGGQVSMSVSNNISYGNARGLSWSGAPDSLLLSCNDWFANRLGGVVGIASHDSTDFSVDPRFCGVAHDSVGLQTNSPLLNATECGPIGARGAACDVSTATLVTSFTAQTAGDGVELRWQFSPGAGVTDVRIERNETASAPWIAITPERHQEGSLTIALDREAGGDSRRYRLQATTDRGEIMTVGPITFTSAVPELAMDPLSPNPSGGPVRIRFAIPRNETMRLSVLDVQGREVARLADHFEARGRHAAVWDARLGSRATPAGVYFLRLTASGQSLVRRLVLR